MDDSGANEWPAPQDISAATAKKTLRPKKQMTKQY